MTDVQSLCHRWVSRVFALARAPTRVEAQLEGVDHYMLALLTLMSSAAKITLYTHTACPFAQRVWIALEHTKVEFERVDVNLYGSGGFDKRALKQVEERGGPGEEKTGPAKARSAARERPLLTRPGPAGAPAGPGTGPARARPTYVRGPSYIRRLPKRASKRSVGLFDRGVREILCLCCLLLSLWRSRSWPV